MIESKFKGVHIPSGCTVKVGDSVDTLESIGVIPMDTNTELNITYDKLLVQGSKKEEVISYIKNMKAKGTTEIYQIQMPVINKLTGGVMNIENVAGTKVTGFVQDFNGWAYGKFIKLKNQNADGSALVLSQVKASNKGVLTDSNYLLAANSEGEYGIIILNKTGKPALSETITVTYEYTPASHLKVTMGDDVATITPKVVQFLKMQGDKKFQVTLYSALVEGGIKFTFPGSDSEKPASIPIEIDAALDTTRDSGDQLLEIIDEIGV